MNSYICTFPNIVSKSLLFDSLSLLRLLRDNYNINIGTLNKHQRTHVSC